MDLVGFYSIFFALLIPAVFSEISKKWKEIRVETYAACVFVFALVVTVIFLGLAGMKPVYISILWTAVSTGIFWYRAK